jgi:uncharacterized protein (TIGR00730 family)
MIALTSLCVYCGSSTGTDPAHRAAAERLGRLMAEHGVRLVFGGGRVGLMGVLADAVLAAGGQVTGIIPGHIEEREIGHQQVTELLIVDNMHERKHKMFELADAFAVLPGGLGTLDETFEIITWRQLGLHDKPIVLIDSTGYWKPLEDLLEHVITGDFANGSVRRLYQFVDSVDEVFDVLAKAPPPATPAQDELI